MPGRTAASLAGRFVESGGTIYGTIVKSLRWAGKPYPGAEIDDNVITIPDCGDIYFGEIYISDLPPPPDDAAAGFVLSAADAPDDGATWKTTARGVSRSVAWALAHEARHRVAPAAWGVAAARSAPSAITRNAWTPARSPCAAAQLDAARKLAEQGVALTSAQPDSEWAWRFTLLLAEVRSENMSWPKLRGC